MKNFRFLHKMKIIYSGSPNSTNLISTIPGKVRFQNSTKYNSPIQYDFCRKIDKYVLHFFVPYLGQRLGLTFSPRLVRFFKQYDFSLPQNSYYLGIPCLQNECCVVVLKEMKISQPKINAKVLMCTNKKLALKRIFSYIVCLKVELINLAHFG